MQNERRSLPRRPIRVSAFIERQYGEPLPCRIMDLSPISARLSGEGLSLPDTFTVTMKLSTNVRRYCKVIWRSGYEAGIVFQQWPTKANA
jgi:hypothetical protein